jgi:hypothetical protein
MNAIALTPGSRLARSLSSGRPRGRTRWLGRDDDGECAYTLFIVTETFGPFLMVWYTTQ